MRKWNGVPGPVTCMDLETSTVVGTDARTNPGRVQLTSCGECSHTHWEQSFDMMCPRVAFGNPAHQPHARNKRLSDTDSQDHAPRPAKALGPDSGTDEPGHKSATPSLMPLIYDELRALAAKLLSGQDRHQTLQPTALVHEAYLKLLGKGDWTDRAHFFNVAAMAMRQLLADHARRLSSQKHGGGWERVTLSGVSADEGGEVDTVALDEALRKLAKLNERQCRIAELRFLTGLSVEEAAEALGVSARTVELDWRIARAWLRRELEPDSRP